MSQGWHEDFEREHRLHLSRSGVQCDGCLADMPVVDGIHYFKNKPHMVCTAKRYVGVSCGERSDTLALVASG